MTQNAYQTLYSAAVEKKIRKSSHRSNGKLPYQCFSRYRSGTAAGQRPLHKIVFGIKDVQTTKRNKSKSILYVYI